MKKLLTLVMLAALLTGCSSTGAKTDEQLKAEGWVKNPTENGYVLAGEEGNSKTDLPAPRDTTKTYKPDKDSEAVACEENTYAPGCSSINAENLQDFLGRDDVVYIDLRDYADYSQKHLRNFEVIPFFASIWNKDANTDTALTQLYGGDVAAPVAVYEESDDLLEALFPKDQTIFLMCQSGGRVVNMMKILEAKGYDMSKIYNVGGMGQYTSKELSGHVTDTLELKVEATYATEGLTRAK